MRIWHTRSCKEERKRKVIITFFIIFLEFDLGGSSSSSCSSCRTPSARVGGWTDGPYVVPHQREKIIEKRERESRTPKF